MWVIAAIAFAVFWLPGILGPYGYFIDELYYLACSRHLDWGYVDHPPLAPWMLWAIRNVFGDSLPALRVVPAAIGAACVVGTAWLARRLGGGGGAQCLAGVGCFAVVPFQIAFGMFSMNALEVAVWLALTALAYEAPERPRAWVAFGVVAGIGLLNKHPVATLGAAVVVGLALTPARRAFGARWLWIGGAVAASIALPNIVWQFANHWPSLEFYRNAHQYKNVDTPPHAVVFNQVLAANPGTLPLWLTGLWAMARGRGRHLVWAWVILMAMMVISGSSRPDRIAGAFPIFMAAGAVHVARWRRGRWWVAGALAVFIAVMAPVGLPVLPPERLAPYVAALGVVPKIEKGSHKISPLPQWFADRLEWPVLVDDVRAAVERMSPRERASAVVFAPTYGQAGALEHFGDDLPRVYSPHNTYHLWGPPPPAPVWIILGGSEDELRRRFQAVELARTHRCTHCPRWRDAMPIWIARGPARDPPIEAVWETIRYFR